MFIAVIQHKGSAQLRGAEKLWLVIIKPNSAPLNCAGLCCGFDAINIQLLAELRT
jgi:hypothetical protein